MILFLGQWVKEPATRDGVAGSEFRLLGLLEGFAHGGMAMHFGADERLKLAFALQEEVTTHAGELVRPGLRHFERELPDVLATDQTHGDTAHTSSASASLALNFSWDKTHSCCSTSSRTLRYTG